MVKQVHILANMFILVQTCKNSLSYLYYCNLNLFWKNQSHFQISCSLARSYMHYVVGPSVMYVILTRVQHLHANKMFVHFSLAHRRI